MPWMFQYLYKNQRANLLIFTELLLAIETSIDNTFNYLNIS